MCVCVCVCVCVCACACACPCACVCILVCNASFTGGQLLHTLWPKEGKFSDLYLKTTRLGDNFFHMGFLFGIAFSHHGLRPLPCSQK